MAKKGGVPALFMRLFCFRRREWNTKEHDGMDGRAWLPFLVLLMNDAGMGRMDLEGMKMDGEGTPTRARAGGS